MIDIALRERQFSRVLGFLDEQLGDNDVTIVFGDASDGRVYFVSNRPLAGYQQHGGIYVKDAGRLEDIEKEIGDFHKDRFRTVISRYEMFAGKSGERREPTPFETKIMNVKGHYAWNFSREFYLALGSHFPDTHPLWIHDDCITCHEGAHGIAAETLPVQRWGDAVLEEALAQYIEISYALRFYGGSAALCIWDELYKRLKHPNDIHVSAARRYFDGDASILERQQQIRERNLARKDTARGE